MDSLKKAHPEIDAAMKGNVNGLPKEVQQRLDSIKIANGDNKNTKFSLPTLPQQPDLAKLNKTVGQSMGSLNKVLSTNAAANKKGLPQKSNTPFSATKTTVAQILTWASSMFDKAKVKAGPVLLPVLENAYNDTATNPASAGMMMIATGLPKCTGQYLVCKYLAAHPQSASTLNDFGVFLRLDKDYAKAIPVFLFAKNLNDTSLEISCNLAWTYAYAGDFSNAKKYFNTILKVNPKYGSALEGISLIAYQEGDKQTFWKSLTQQLFYNSKSNGLGLGGTSNAMGSFADAVLTEEEVNKLTGGQGNAADNVFNNMPSPNPDAQSNDINIEGDEEIDYPSYVADFPNDMEHISSTECSGFQSKYMQAKQKDVAYVTSLLSTLPKPQQFINSDGDLETIYDYANDSHYKLFYKIHQQFEKRSTAIMAASSSKIERAIEATSASWIGEYNAFLKALSGCKNEECQRSVLCDYIPRLCGILRNFGMSIGDITTKGFSRMDDESGWYINASSPMLQFIAEPNWNKYLNAVREVDMRSLKLNLMALYQHALAIAANFVQQAKIMAADLKVSCVFELRILQQKIQSKYKDLKTLAPPCNGSYSNSGNSSKNLLNPRATKVDVWKVHYESDCSHSKLVIDEGTLGTTIPIGPIKGGAEITKSMFWETCRSRFTEDDYTRNGFIIHAKASMGISKSLTEGIGDVNITAAGGIKAEAEATMDFFDQFDQKGNLTQKGVAFDVTAKTSGNAGVAGDIMGIDDSKTDIMKSGFQKGIHASGELWVVAGADGQLGNYQYGKINVETINK
ncbi:tetratricopeptide repeat protein [Ferruginibacter sp. SUN106]|uniref:tetratricopeptide repeat protein n=1 Tax=Ferruginibacter sp. SUN106 TaxID=2978348 RepID=UPI003D36D60C